MFETMEHLVTDSYFIPQAEHGQSFGREGLMSQAPECLGCLRCASYHFR